MRKKHSKLITTNEAAEMLGITPYRVRELAKQLGRGQQLQDRTWVFSGSDIAILQGRKQMRGRPAITPISSYIDILEQLERDGKIADVSEVRVVVRARPEHEVIARIKNDKGKTLYIVR